MRLLFRLFCFIAAALTPAAQAAQVTTTITGTLASGIDFTGVFGFPPNTDLTSQPYTLTYTFDDTKGTQSLGSCQGSSGVSSIMSTTTSNPGTAVLKIGTGAWTFGSLPAPFAESTDSRVVIGVTSAGPQSMTLTVDDSDNKTPILCLQTFIPRPARS